MKAILLCEEEKLISDVYNDEILEELYTYGLDKKIYKKEDLTANSGGFYDTEFIFSTWGISILNESEIKSFFPNLKCVFYSAGTVKHFAKPFLNCGVKVFSAWAANAVPVAEFTVAQIVLANKGYFFSSRLLADRNYAGAREMQYNFKGNYNRKVGIIGAGMIGKYVIKLLKSYKVDIKVFDPFLPEETALELGVEKVSLEKLFSECDIISNHLANNDETKNMLTYDLFAKMKPYSAFINTGRALQVEEEGFVKILKERPDICAVIDVFWKEPLREDSPLFELENCFMSPHMAGAWANECWRLAEYMMDEFKCYIENKSLKYEITPKILETMA